MENKENQPLLLLVDDVPTNIRILADALRHDYRIMVATNGMDALQLAQQVPQPDLILLDVMMPGMDGYEVCRQLKNNPATVKIPVIFVTAKNTEEDEERGFLQGGVDYITKPVSLPIVRARVRTHVQLKQQADFLESLSHIDPLTHIANRRRFQDVLAQEWSRTDPQEGVASHPPLSVLMIDIDHFKDFNDHYGHGAGDECLRRVAHTLQQSLEIPGALLARYGGEEFVAILPNTALSAAQSQAEKMRRQVELLQQTHAFSSTSSVVTVSVGAASSDQANILCAEELLAQADSQLYRAKQQGRNRISSSLTE